MREFEDMRNPEVKFDFQSSERLKKSTHLPFAVRMQIHRRINASSHFQIYRLTDSFSLNRFSLKDSVVYDCLAVSNSFCLKDLSQPPQGEESERHGE